ncbi:MAG TPA: hypothetical protein ENH10_06245 [Bacteroidetes bacterium]|nr:hypothetical protein BMS3Bbin04_00585 [bacterium BMS3Bbin04]HDO65618.1 hypothetical protein [Bacteroidota bacterium]HEX04743.1 hypothetical protein [Bacteroidota bacterium]
MNMKSLRRQWLFLLLPAIALLLGGCVTHSILISFTGEGKPEASYTIEGDSLDVFDDRIPLPSKEWTIVKREVGEDSSGNIVASYIFSATQFQTLSHPIAPMGEVGSIDINRDDHWFYSSTEVIVSFPNWHAIERYGDPEAYVPEEVRIVEESGLDSSLSVETEEELERMDARGQQLWTVDRYLRQMERLVRTVLADDIDSSAVRDAVERFAPIVRAHVMTLRGDNLEPTDPRNVSLEWYPVLRDPMIIAANEATGIAPETLATTLDSLEDEYKRWVDLEDDTVQLALVLPDAHFHDITPEPEESRGDTLFWTVPREVLATDDFTIIAAGYTLSWMPAILGGLFIGMVGGFIVRKARKKRST